MVSDREDLNFTKLNSSGLAVMDHWKMDVYRYAVPVMMVLCLLSYVENVYILFATRWLRRSVTPNLMFTLSLTASDAWVSLAVGVGLLLNSYLPIVHQDNILGTSGFCFNLGYESFRVGAMITSIFHLLALAVNHYVSILRPLHYYSWVTPEIVFVAVVVMWICPPLSFLGYFLLVPGQAFRSAQCQSVGFLVRLQFRLTVALFILVPLVLMALIYGHIFSIVAGSKQRQRRLGSRRSTATAAVNRPEAKIGRKYSALKTTALILGTYVFGWLPNVLFFLCFCENCLFRLELYRLEVFWLSFTTNCLIIGKCLLDPIIYAARVREVATAIRSMNAACRHRLQPTESFRAESHRLSLLPSTCKNS